MIFSSYKLDGENAEELNTEIRFIIAISRQDGNELLRLTFVPAQSGSAQKRTGATVRRLLNTMRQNGLIQFVCTREDIEEKSVAAEFLINKYPEFVTEPIDEYEYVYIKL